MMVLGIGVDGIAYSPCVDEVRAVASGDYLPTGIDGVGCWLLGGVGGSNVTATTYLLSVGSIGDDDSILGAVTFGAIDADGLPTHMNEVAAEALGWAIARSVAAAAEQHSRRAA